MLPPEIWQWILRYAIAAPEFLDPDYWVDRFPPKVIRRRDDLNFQKYLEAESTLKTLQRVCKTWEEYLSRYAHRFVDMSDVVHGKVSVEDSRSAIRIRFNGHADIFCENCKPEKNRLDGEVTVLGLGEYFGYCRQIFEQEQSFKVEILECDYYGYGILWGLISPQKVPNLTTVLDEHEAACGTEHFRDIVSLPFLRYANIKITGSGDGAPIFISSTLTTLVLTLWIPNPSFALFTDKNLSLPSLRHLEIQHSLYHRLSIYDEPAWLPLLKVVGKKLRTLCLPLDVQCRQATLPGQIWTLCPKLEDLRYFGPFPDKPPPERHPLHTIDVDVAWIIRFKEEEIWVWDWPGLHTVRFDVEWEEWSLSETSIQMGSPLEWFGSRLRVEDMRGESYMEWLSRVNREK